MTAPELPRRGPGRAPGLREMILREQRGRSRVTIDLKGEKHNGN